MASIVQKNEIQNQNFQENQTMTSYEHMRSAFGRKCVLGVCAMSKKTQSLPMTQLLDRLRAYSEFEVIIFDINLVLDESIPVSSWPLCHCLIAFFSTGFPLHRAIEYVRVRKPYCINNVELQSIFRNRVSVLSMLEEHDIPTAKHLIVIRNSNATNKLKMNGIELCDTQSFLEGENFIEVNGERLEKPFAEKPVDGDDHNVYIYHRNGGSTRLFRKEHDRSSIKSEISSVRRNGSYIYEAYLRTSRDVKLYTVGQDYVHGETRKSPVIDGLVLRDPDGKEKRSLIRLSSHEKAIAATITQIFGQNVCGFDICRSGDRSFVVDVNGWSFVKGNMRYYDKCGKILREMMLSSEQGRIAMSMNLSIASPRFSLPSSISSYYSNTHINPLNGNVLRSVCAVLRHADRRPKRKLKMKTFHPDVISLFRLEFGVENFCSGAIKEIKYTMPKQLHEFQLLLHGIMESSYMKSCSDIDVFLLIRNVLLRGLPNTAIQIKPHFSNGDIKSAQIVCKWGGELTGAGYRQVEEYVPLFWEHVFGKPMITSKGQEKKQELDDWMEASNLFVSDMQAFSSDEPRVLETANTFMALTSQCFIPEKRKNEDESDLPGYSCSTSLSSSIASFSAPVQSGDEIQYLLNDLSSTARDKIQSAKDQIKRILSVDKDMTEVDEEYCEMTAWTRRKLHWISQPTPKQQLFHLLSLLHSLYDHLNSFFGESRAKLHTQNEAGISLCQGEPLEVMLERWNTIIAGFYKTKTGEFDTSKIPVIYDCIRYDVLHNLHLFVSPSAYSSHGPHVDSSSFFRSQFHVDDPSTPAMLLNDTYHITKLLADFVTAQEYGITPKCKKEISAAIVSPLFKHLLNNLESGISGDQKSQPRAFLYFSSESHIHAIRNALFLSSIPLNESVSTTLDAIEPDYLSHCLFRLYEDLYETNADRRFYVSVEFSPGAALDPFAFVEKNHLLPISRPVPVNGRIPFFEFKRILEGI